jgi:hypothetical protein
MIANPVAEDLGLLEVVRRQQHRPAGRPQPEHDLPERPPGRRVHAGRRLVEEDELGSLTRARATDRR